MNDKFIELMEDIRIKFINNQFEFSKHATDQSILREIRVVEIRQAIKTGEIIEDYPNDKYGPSCLILGFIENHRAIHIHCSYPTRPLIKIITVYEPDTVKWIDNKVRRR